MEKQDYVQYKGIIRDHMLLKNEIVQNHALIMPSVNELFGLVFIEAISQNTAVVYPKNEGIASYLDNRNVGVSVDAQDEHSIEQGILQLKKDYNKYGNISQIAKKFDWNIITKKFSELYKENLNEQD
jgi:glycosyltransferase involved in cell wall biosynthesis